MSKYAVFTMDVEAFSDTECISNLQNPVDIDIMDGFDEYIKILDKYGIKSTLFTVGSFAPQIADKLKKYISRGHRLALHSYDHRAPMELSPLEFRTQTAGAKSMLEKLFGTDVVGYRAPCFSIDSERLEILRELGFRYDSSHLGFPARHTVKLDLSGYSELTHGIFKKGGFFEFGLSGQQLFGHSFPVSGGGYVRLSNWEFIKSLIWQYIRNNDYYVFYLHPFELTHQKIPFIKELKSYDKYYTRVGIKSYAFKIEQIIKMLKRCGYQFVTFEQLTEIIK